MIETPCSHIWAPTWLSLSTAVLSAILLIFTVVGNLLVCFAVYKDPHKRLRTPFMFILVNLAVTDLVVGVITLPLIVATHSLEALGTKKNEHVIITRMTYFISCTASILNLTAFCVDRYIAINWPIKYRRLLNTRVCLMIFVAIWVTAIIISCLYLVAGFINFLFIFAQVSFFFAIVICGVTFRLLRKLVIYSRERKTITNRSKSTRKADKKVTKLFLVMLFMFFICYTPAIIMMYTLKFCPKCHCTFRHVLRDLQFLFIVSNSAVNPFVCTIRLKPFRQALTTIFSKVKKKDIPGVLPAISLRPLQKQGTAQFSVVMPKHEDIEPILSKQNEEEEDNHCNGKNGLTNGVNND
ncbi:melanocyte-stimulating hormone receptor-like [Hydractinia symbiolongicarpus]|uniref:melanocyte-stimulating hormone receptor-like n=1 Tax=Hydractinia symbiolongicarpus TaxID=13093 RepID=UPI00254C2B6C|nr:melanocyte-stimulating hormone receptor-like [Hydractinia symbiolongicarpus]XP_057306064.1 melanocyte-stimulating hormone receptor-like [Hydractinia symbiolongicarpus]XP_057306065.1 melanocyte-stimulating hormone receptor-like [Hydractinia symbiolongicarpus]XP_057306066.1 melanocyte-stimulating hormone receptor-like [Hydractinia symbiolongicarpus]